MILAWPRWKIIEQAELQLDCREWGCMPPGCGSTLLQKAAAQLQLVAQYSSLTALAWWEVLFSLQKLSCHWEEVSMEKQKIDTSEPDNSMPLILFSLHRFLVTNRGESTILWFKHGRGLQSSSQLLALILISWVTLDRSHNSLFLDSPLIKMGITTPVTPSSTVLCLQQLGAAAV